MADEDTTMEAQLRENKISAMVGIIEHIGEDNQSAEQYLVALTICAARHIRRHPLNMRSKLLHQFLQAVRVYSGERHDTH